MIGEGHDDDQIIDFMVEHYGNFVLYRPPWKLTTAALWLAPLGLALAGGALAFRAIARPRVHSARQLTGTERAGLERLVDSAANQDDEEPPLPP